MEWEKNCLYCQSPMKVESSSRGITTYGCSRGCSDYQYEEKTAQAAAPVISNGTIQNGQPADNASAQIAATA